MKKMYLTLLPLLLAGHCALADNSRGFYAGANASMVSSGDLAIAPDIDGSDDIDLGAIELVGGYKYNGYLGVDVRFATGIIDSSLQTTNTIETEYSLGSYYSLYYRPEMINTKGRFYGLFGYSSLSVDMANVDEDGNTLAEDSESKSGFSAGIGAGWFLENNLSINAEYRGLLITDDETVMAVTFGLDYRF